MNFRPSPNSFLRRPPECPEAYLHSYVWIEAAQSFHQALRLDDCLARVSDRERTRILLRGLQMDYLQDSGDIKNTSPIARR